MKRKVLKALACGMAICMAAATLAGCGSDPGDSSVAGGGNNEDPNANIFPAYDMGGVELTMLKYNSLTGLDPESVNTKNEDGTENEAKVIEKAEKQARKEAIEAKYNVKITFVDPPSSDWDTLAPEIIMKWTNGTPVADIMDAYSSFGLDYVQNGILYDFTNDFKANPVIDSRNYFTWLGSQWGVRFGQAGWGLWYNKDMIEELGMEKTPAEMFAEGHWSYAEALAYMKEMKNKMTNPDDYPFYAPPWYYLILAPGGNGTACMDVETGALTYADDPFIEVCQFYADCVKEGVMPALVKNEEGAWTDGKEAVNVNYWAVDTFAKNTKFAIALYEAWRADGINKPDHQFDIGYVPFPWGSRITIDQSKIGQPDAYLTLSDNYTCNYYDNTMLVMVKGIEKKVNPVHAMSMLLDWKDAKSAMAGYVEPEGTVRTGAGWIEDGIDKDLYFFALSRAKWDPHSQLPFEESGLGGTYTFYSGKDFRSQLWARYNEEQPFLIEKGYSNPDVYHPFEVPEN